MLYYKVKPEADGETRFVRNPKRHVIVADSSLIGNELYTPGEFKKLANRRDRFIPTEIPKTETFFSFGARFEMHRETKAEQALYLPF